MKVFVMSIDSNYGTTLQAFDSMEKVKKAQFEFVEENWHRVIGDDLKLDTLSQDEAIEKYFENSYQSLGDEDVMDWDEVEIQ